MPGPRAEQVVVSEAERRELERLVRAHTTPQHIARRARIVLHASAGGTNSAIGQALGVDRSTVCAWRTRWIQRQLQGNLSVQERLEDNPRPGPPPRITAGQFCQIVALACEAPDRSGRPITHWTGREIADEIMGRGIVEQISARHASRLIKRGIYSPTESVGG